VVARLDEPLAGAVNQVHLVTGITGDPPTGDQREVIAAQFFARGAWPDNLAVSHQAGLDAWVTAAATALRA
jgi:hypothetical protein